MPFEAPITVHNRLEQHSFHRQLLLSDLPPFHGYRKWPSVAHVAGGRIRPHRMNEGDLTWDHALDRSRHYVDTSSRDLGADAWTLARSTCRPSPHSGVNLLSPQQSYLALGDFVPPLTGEPILDPGGVLASLVIIGGPSFIEQVWERPDVATAIMEHLPRDVCWIYPGLSFHEQSLWLFRSLWRTTLKRFMRSNTRFSDWAHEAVRCGFRVAVLGDGPSLWQYLRDKVRPARLEASTRLYIRALRLAETHMLPFEERLRDPRPDPYYLQAFGPYACLQLGSRIFVRTSSFHMNMPTADDPSLSAFHFVTFPVSDLALCRPTNESPLCLAGVNEVDEACTEQIAQVLLEGSFSLTEFPDLSAIWQKGDFLCTLSPKP